MPFLHQILQFITIQVTKVFSFTFTDFQGVKIFSGGKNHQFLRKNNQCFQCFIVMK